MPVIRVEVPLGTPTDAQKTVRPAVKAAVLKALAPRQTKYDYVAVRKVVAEIAEDEGRCSPDAGSIGEDGVPLYQRIQARDLHVARKPLGIETDGAGDAQDMVKVEWAVRPQQCPMKRLVKALRP